MHDDTTPLAFGVIGSRECISLRLLPNRSLNWCSSSSVRCVSWIASSPIFLLHISCGTSIHLLMSPDFLPLMFSKAILMLTFAPLWHCASTCAHWVWLAPCPCSEGVVPWSGWIPSQACGWASCLVLSLFLEGYAWALLPALIA